MKKGPTLAPILNTLRSLAVEIHHQRHGKFQPPTAQGNQGQVGVLIDDSLLKMLYLAMIDITKKWTGRRQDWSRIHAQLSVFFAERMPE